MQELVDVSFDDIINDLVKMRCIEVNDNIIWLREWVREHINMQLYYTDKQASKDIWACLYMRLNSGMR